MEYMLIGKYTSTHGLKGEIKILPFYEEAFKLITANSVIYIGNDKKEYTVKTSRLHQKYIMITLDGLDTIESVIAFRNSNIYINKEDIKIDLLSDIIGYKVYNNDLYIGDIKEILKGVKYNMIVVGENRLIVPYIKEFILGVDKDNKSILINYK